MQARPTVYEGVLMRSRLEARTAAFLDRCRYRWEYEPLAFGARAGQYLPDFWVDYASRPTYLEVKGPTPDEAGLQDILDRMLVIRASEPDAFLMLCSESMLRHGYFAFNVPGLKYWAGAQMVMCPEHPDRVHLSSIRSAGIAPWCWECDPNADVYVPLEDTKDYWFGESA